jgi:hypothetical protein
MKKWLCGVLVIAACSSCAIDSENRAMPPLLGKGWQCMATASDFDAPGTIFRQDKSGATYGTIDLSKEVGVTRGQVAIGAVHSNFVTNLGLAAGLLKLKSGVTGNVSAGATKTYVVDADYGNAIKELTYDVDAVRAKTWFATYPHREAGSTYYLIREAIAAKDLKYTVTSDLLADLGGEANVGGQFTVTLSEGKPEVDRKRSYTLQKTVEHPLRVCFKAEKLVQTSSGIDGSANFDLVPLEAPLAMSTYQPLP